MYTKYCFNIVLVAVGRGRDGLGAKQTRPVVVQDVGPTIGMVAAIQDGRASRNPRPDNVVVASPSFPVYGRLYAAHVRHFTRGHRHYELQ